MEACTNGRFELFISPAIVEEFARVSREHFGWDEKKVRIHVRLLNKTGKVVAPKSIPDVIKEDPDDNHILACAIVSSIDFLHPLEGYKKAA